MLIVECILRWSDESKILEGEVNMHETVACEWCWLLSVVVVGGCLWFLVVVGGC